MRPASIDQVEKWNVRDPIVYSSINEAKGSTMLQEHTLELDLEVL